MAGPGHGDPLRLRLVSEMPLELPAPRLGTVGRELWLPGGRRWCLSEHRGVRGRRDFPEGLHGSLLLLPVLPLPSASSRAWDNACATGTDTQLSPELREGWLLPGWHCGGCRHRNDPTSCCPWHPEASLSLGPLEWTLSTETPGLGCQRGADPHGACPPKQSTPSGVCPGSVASSPPMGAQRSQHVSQQG